MKAIIVQEAGPAANLQLTDIPVPALADHEVLVAVNAISINPVDVKARGGANTLNWLMGDERPAILGWDISGKVTETGKSVTQFKPGDAVFGMVHFPGKGKAYAAYVAADAAHLALKPEPVSHEDAAATTLAALTALQVLQNRIRPGQKVLIHAAAGGVGHFAVPIAKHLGAYVTGTSSAANKDFVLSLGADEHVDYATTPFEEKAEQADLILDTLAGDTLKRSVEAAKPGATIVTIPSSDIPAAVRELAEARGVHLSFVLVRSDGEDMQTLARLLQEGVLKPHVSRVFAFDQMKEAHEAVETGKIRGKVIVKV